jgi:hypothetical protein
MLISLLLFLQVSLSISQNNQSDPVNATIKPVYSQLYTDAGRHLVPERWWESVATTGVATLKPQQEKHLHDAGFASSLVSLPIQDSTKLVSVLDDLQVQGLQTLSVHAPSEGGISFGGFDVINHFRIDPAFGTMDDFKRLVRLAHIKGLPIIVNLNLGYCSVDAPEFLKACDDVRAGKKSKWVDRFLWSDDPNTPPPGTSDKVFFAQPKHLPGGEPGTLYESEKYEFWQYSERAQRYYWTKWGGVDLRGNKVRLPQYNWASESFLEEVEQIIRFWMDTGLDGMLVDAVNWYIDCTWEKNKKYMTDVIASYGNTYSQPEGGGAFLEDPVSWITEGGWNSVQDYSLGTPWRKGTNVIVNAIESGDPRPIEEVLRNYHDRVVAVDGVLWFRPPKFEERDKQRLSVAAVACTGTIMSGFQNDYVHRDQEILWMVETKRNHPALHNLSTRRGLATNADDKYYAFLRTAADGSERILVVLNFQSQKQKVEVDLSGVATAGLVDLKDGSVMARQNPLDLELPAYGYRLFQVLPAVLSK